MFLSFFMACLIPLVACLWILTLFYSRWNTQFVPPEPWRWAAAIILSLVIGCYGIIKKSLNRSGFIAGVTVGFIITVSSLSFFSALLTFFIFGSRITKFRSDRKKKIEGDFKEGGQRDWIQVFSNGGPATIFSMLYMIETSSLELPFHFKSYYKASWYAMAVLASLSCACGDTFASEIGSVVGSNDPFLITAWKRVPRGTNGGVSTGGTLGSLLGGFLVGAMYYLSLIVFVPASYLQEAPPQWPLIIYATLAGGFGSVIDSVLGGTLQFSGKHKKLGVIVEHDGPDVQKICGRDILDNHNVNLLSCAITGLIIPYFAAVTWNKFVWMDLS